MLKLIAIIILLLAVSCTDEQQQPQRVLSVDSDCPVERKFFLLQTPENPDSCNAGYVTGDCKCCHEWPEE